MVTSLVFHKQKCRVDEMDNEKQCRLAIVGIGLVGQRHADAIAQVKNAALVAIADQSEDGRAYAERLGVPYFECLSSLMDQAAPDGIILSTPTNLHAEQGLLCISRAIPVLVEKPLATSTDAARPLVEAAQKAQVPLLVGHHRRYNPIIQKAKEIILSGEIGDIRAVHATCWFYKPDHYFEEATWRKLKGAGPISVNLVHDVDLIRYLCGDIAVVQAHAAPSRRGFDNEDVAAAVFTLQNGAIGSITVSDSIVAPWSWEMTSREYPIYPMTSQSCYHIGGTHGSLSIPDLQLWSHKQKRDWWTPMSATVAPRDSTDPLINQIEHFIRVIQGAEAPLVSGCEGFRSLQVIEAIQKAADTLHPVTIKKD